MPNFIRTVCGDVNSHKIKNVLIHEHVVWNLINQNKKLKKKNINLGNRWQTNYENNQNPQNSVQDNSNIAIKELKILKTYGGDLIVDQSTFGIGRNVKLLKKISKKSNVKIVAAAGTYKADFIPKKIQLLNVKELTKRFTNEIQIGINNTDIKAGIIGEIGCSEKINKFEKNALIAAAKTSIVTGAAISIHPDKNPESPFKIINILEKAKADISRVAICHIDRTYPLGDKLKELLQKGVYIEWDFFGIENSNLWLDNIELPMDRDRIKLIKKIFKLGYGDKILISQDICSKTRLHNWGGHGYDHIFRNIIPLMKHYNLNHDEIDKLVRKNPVNLLSIQR